MPTNVLKPEPVFFVRQPTIEEWPQIRQLLQRELRSPSEGIRIEDEYPLVLGPNHLHNSLIAVHNAEIVSHLNFQIRSMINESGQDAGRACLIGNVATANQHQRQGYAKLLLTQVENIAASHKADVMLLWTDLNLFYQKLGYQSWGHEDRWHFEVNKLPKLLPKQSVSFYCRDASLQRPKKSNFDLLKNQDLVQLRPKVPYTIRRNNEDLQSLLDIPETYTFWLHSKGKIEAFACIGRGCDMRGVVHEWGSMKGENFLGLLRSVGEFFGLKELLVLSPSSLEKEWEKTFAPFVLERERHPMALAKFINKQPAHLQDFENLFVWGLDSI